MAKPISDEKGQISTHDFYAMYVDISNNFSDFCHGVALRRADDLELNGVKRGVHVFFDRFYRLPKLTKTFNTACLFRCLFACNDKPEDVLYKLAYPQNNFK